MTTANSETELVETQEGIPVSDVVTDDVLKPLVQDEEERENIKQDLKALESLRQRVLLRSASKTNPSSNSLPSKALSFRSSIWYSCGR